MKLTDACAECFAGLSCHTRIDIINLLKGKKFSVLEIAQHFKVSQPTITHHLKYLETTGILVSEKEGRKVYYTLHPKCDQKTCNIFS